MVITNFTTDVQEKLVKTDTNRFFPQPNHKIVTVVGHLRRWGHSSRRMPFIERRMLYYPNKNWSIVRKVNFELKTMVVTMVGLIRVTIISFRMVSKTLAPIHTLAR